MQSLNLSEKILKKNYFDFFKNIPYIYIYIYI